MIERESRPTANRAAKVSSSTNKTDDPTVGDPTDTGVNATLRKDLYFAQIPEWVLFHAELSPQAVRLYGVLNRYADSDGQCFPARATLATKLNVRSVDTVDRALKELVTASAVTVTRRLDDAGDPTSSSYTVHFTPPEGVAARMRPPSRTDAATGGRTDAALTRVTSNQNPQSPHGCAIHVEAAQPNCRACGTNPRSSQRHHAAEEVRLARERDRAQSAAEARAARSSTDPEVQQLIAQAREHMAASRTVGDD